MFQPSAISGLRSTASRSHAERQRNIGKERALVRVERAGMGAVSGPRGGSRGRGCTSNQGEKTSAPLDWCRPAAVRQGGENAAEQSHIHQWDHMACTFLGKEERRKKEQLLAGVGGWVFIYLLGIFDILLSCSLTA